VHSDRRTAITFGVLLILGILFGILNTVPELEYPDYLVTLSSIKTKVLLYPVIKKYDNAIALGYFGFRIIGAAFLFLGIVSLLALLFLSQSFVSAGQLNSSYFQTMGELLRAGRDWMNHIGMILPWSLGGLILFYCLFRMKLVPQWLSIWGIIGSLLTLMATFLLMFDVIKIVTPTYFIMNTPTALLELTLALYLIIKGFKPSAVNINR
jgi:branched-subunit amino acid transport protein AzlD